MAFRDFHYPELLTTFGLTSEPSADLFRSACSVLRCGEWA